MDILDVFRMPLLRRVNESSYRPAILDGQEPRRPYRRSHEDRRKVAVDAGQHDCGWDSDSTRRWSSDSVKQKHATHSHASAASASTMIVTNGKEASVASGAWFAYVHLAMFDAVNAIDHRFQPYLFTTQASADASQDAAAVAAAHRVPVYYFSAEQPSLDAQFKASLAG